jgi:hypothetical protein
MRGTNDGTNGYFISDTGSGGAASPYFSWQCNTTERMRLDNAGNLSTTGDYFGGTVTASKAASNGAYNNITVAGDALIKGAPAAPSLPVTLAVHNGSAIRLSGNTIQMRSANSASDAVVIDASGNLLVGTSTARGLITSNAPTGGPAISATGKTSTNVAADIEINRAGTITNVGQGAALQFNDSVTPTNSRLVQAGAGNFQFFGYGTGGWVEHARLDINGSLCVGASATTYGTQDIAVFNRAQNDVTRLMVNNQSSGTSAQTMLELAAYGASWRMYVPSSTNNTNPLIFVCTGVGGGEKARITSDGKLFIGRSSDDGSTAMLQVAGSQSIAGHAYINGAIGGYTGYDSGLVVNYAGNGSQFGVALKPSSSTSDTNAITFLSSTSSYSAGVRVGAIQHRGNDACMNLDGTWQYQGYPILNSNAPTINKPTIKGYIEQFQAINPGATVTLNPDNGTLIEMQVTANATITLPAAVAGVCYTLIVYYQGAYSLTFTGGTSLHWAGGTAPASTSTYNKFDKYVFTCGANYTLAQDGGRNF